MKVVLELQDQPSNVRRITVRHDIVIGRGSDCNLRLSAPQVSRRHCFLRVGRDSVSVTDLDSSNGTFIDGTRITAGKRYDISNGAQLALGPIRFVIHVRSEVAVAETANKGSKSESKRSKSGRDAAAGFTADNSNTISAKMQPDDANPPMDYAVEQAGASAEPHEPTADYLDEQLSGNGSANLFSNSPDPADSRVGVADFGKRQADQLDSNQETNDFPDANIVGGSAIAHEEPHWDATIADSSESVKNFSPPSAEDDVASAWLSVDDDDTLLPEPVNLGNAYIGDATHDAFNDADPALADAGVFDDIEEVEEVMEVQERDEVVEVEDVIEVEEELEDVVVEAEEALNFEDAAALEFVDDSEEVAVIEEASADAEDLQVQDWLNFEDAVEVQEPDDAEEIIEVEGSLDEVAVNALSEIQNVPIAESLPELQVDDEIEEASANAEDMQVQDWLNFEDAVEVQEPDDAEEIIEVEGSLDEVAVNALSEIQNVPIAESLPELQVDDEIEEASADAEDLQVQDWLNFEDAVEVQGPDDAEEIIEVEGALDVVAVNARSEIQNVPVAESLPELQVDDEIEEASADAEDLQVQDWLNFEDAVEVQGPDDAEEIIEVEALDVVAVNALSEIQNVPVAESLPELQVDDEIEEVAVIEEASADAEDIQVQDWLNFEYAVEVQEPGDAEEVIEVEEALDEVPVNAVSETEEALNVEEAIEIEADVDNEELAEVEYHSDDIAVTEEADVSEFEDVEQIQESMEVQTPASEPAAADDALQIVVEEGDDSNWFANVEVSESDAFFDNFISPELETDNTNSAEAAEENDDIDPDLQNFLKGF